MRCPLNLWCFVGLVSLPVLAGGRDSPPSSSRLPDGPGQIRAVHYFGDHWPLNFWNSLERSGVDADFARIARDGFNAVILVVPWRSLVVGGTPDAPEFDRDYGDNLRFLFDRAAEHGLSVILRVSYPHDTKQALRSRHGDGPVRLCRDIMLAKDPAYGLWLSSLAHVGSIASESSNWAYSFFSWEDLWCAIKHFPTETASDRRSVAADMGFQRYVTDHVGLDVMSALEGRRLSSPGQVSIPERATPTFVVYKRFVEHLFRSRLLPAAQEHLPGLGFEGRVDTEPIKLPSGEVIWSEYDLFLAGGLRSLYWAPFMGSENEGELIEATDAIGGLRRVLGRATRGGRDTDVLLEQFNVVGNTPQFKARSARIVPEQVPVFLELAAPLLSEVTVGYGLWTYKEYRHSYLFNPSFERGLDGFAVEGDPLVILNSDGDRALQMAGGDRLTQRVEFNGLTDYASAYDAMAFCARMVSVGDRPSELIVRLRGSEVGRLVSTAAPVESCVELRIDYARLQVFERLAIEAEGPGFLLDDMYLYNHVQSAGIYRHDGSEGPYADAYRRLNASLRRSAGSGAPPGPRPAGGGPAAATSHVSFHGGDR